MRSGSQFTDQLNHTAAGNAALRHALYLITEHEAPARHPGLIDVLLQDYPESFVNVLEFPFDGPRVSVNCVMFALDLVYRFEPQLERNALYQYHYLVDTSFLSQAIEAGVFPEITDGSVLQDDLVVYFTQGGAVRHAAKAQGDGSCISKWGAGHLYHHGLWDVPEILGTQIKYYHQPDPTATMAFLCQQVPGVTLVPITQDGLVPVKAPLGRYRLTS